MTDKTRAQTTNGANGGFGTKQLNSDQGTHMVANQFQSGDPKSFQGKKNKPLNDGTR